MAVPLASGRIGDRPWGSVLASLGLEHATGELSLRTDGKTFRVAFSHGLVVGAASPLTADSVGRIALTSHLISSSQVNDIMKRVGAAPQRDEIDVLAELVKLSADQAHRLRHRLVAQRAARTFSIEQGEYAVEEQITIPVCDSRLDIRNVIYLGVRMNLSEQRLMTDLRNFGSRFVLKPDAAADLSRFGFTETERPILEALRDGTSLPELEARHRDIDPRTTQAVLYALASCDVVTAMFDPNAQVAAGRVPTPREPTMSRVPTMREPTSTMPTMPATTSRHVIPRVQTAQGSQSLPKQAVGSQPLPAVSRAPTPQQPVVSRTTTPELQPSRTMTVRRSSLAVREAEVVIASRMQLLQRGCDYFALLGVPFDAPVVDIKAAYVEMARHLHPDKLAELGVTDPDAQKVWVRVGTAFVVLSDPDRRREYLASLRAPKAPLARGTDAGEQPVIRAEGSTPPPTSDPATRAAEAFRRGEQSLRADMPDKAIADLQRACQLVPGDAFYQAMLKWATFCAAFDKQAIAMETRKALERAAYKSDRPELARFYLGRVERMLGRDQEALRHFLEVLEMQPNHADAASEVRVIQNRLRKR